MTESEFDTCVSGFYRAATGAIDWAEALRPYHEHFENWVTQLLALDLDTHSIVFSFELGDSPPETFVHFASGWHMRDPRSAHALGLEAGEWMNCSRIFDQEFVDQDPFFQEFLIPYGGRWVSGSKLIHDGNYVVILALMRGPHQQPYNKEEDELAERLAKHLKQALEIYRAHGMLVSQVSSGMSMMDSLRSPIALIDEQRNIHYANPGARSILNAADAVSDQNGRLICRRATDDSQLLTSLRQLQLSLGGYIDVIDAAPPTKAYVRCPLPASAYHLTIILQTVRPESTLGAFGKIPLAMVFLHDPRLRLEIDPLLIGVAFDLTPAESLLAASLAKGESLADVATHRGVSHNTIKTQLKSVFAKTGATQQSDLVSLLATLPAGSRLHAH